MGTFHSMEIFCTRLDMLLRFSIFAFIFVIISCDEMKILPCEISLCQTNTKCINVVDEACHSTDCLVTARCVKNKPCDTMRCESGYKCIDGVEPGCKTGVCEGTGKCVPTHISD